MRTEAGETELLLAKAGRGDLAAREQLLVVHRERLRRMVGLRLDRRLGPRIDASDVVQEALLDADRELDAYLRRPEMSFYPWPRRFACDRLLKLRWAAPRFGVHVKWECIAKIAHLSSID